jgi:hypothetical protein
MPGRRHPFLGNILLYFGAVLFQFNPLIGDSFSKEFFKLVLAVERLAVVLQRVQAQESSCVSVSEGYED